MMFLLSKTLGVLIIPPGIFLVLLLLSIFLLIKKRKRLVTFLLSSTAFLLYLLSTEVGKNFVLLPLENSYPYPDLNRVNCEAIVVLGGGEIPHSPAENFRASVDPKVAKRLYEAFKLWRKVKKPIVVSGGSVFRSAESEAVAMKRFLTTLGVPSEFVIEEGKSRNTLENAIFTGELLHRKGIEKICLVTSAFHMPRSVRIFETAGFKVIPVPSDYRVYRTPYSWYSFMPMPSYLRDSLCGIREYVGLLYFEFLQKRQLSYVTKRLNWKTVE